METKTVDTWAGINTDERDIDIKDTESPDARNDDISIEGKDKTRNGMSKVQDEAVGSPVVALFNLKSDDCISNTNIGITDKSGGGEVRVLPFTPEWGEASHGISEAGIYGLKVYGGKLFIGTGNASKIYSYDGTTWGFFHNPGQTTTGVFGEYQGLLYAGSSTNGRIYSYDGTNWALTYATDGTTIYCFAVHDNKLYVGGYGGSRIWEFDGTTWAPFTVVPGEGVTALISFNGKLYSGNEHGPNAGRIRAYENGAWVTKLYPWLYGVSDLYEYDGKLYSSWKVNGGKVYSSPDGDNWTLSKDFGVKTAGTLMEYNGKLYAATNNTGSGGIKVQLWEYDGTNWTLVYTGGAVYDYDSAVFKNKLYISADDTIYVLGI